MDVKERKQVIFSGIQPSGCITIGNYIGAIRNWVKLQDAYDCVYSIVNMHSLTVRQDPKTLRDNTLSFFAQFLALGLDPDKNVLFIQSHVKNHAQLSWLLTCYTYIGEMSRMTQFKDKSAKHQDNLNMGLMSYPILMAADILLYGTDLVPVGADQKQHVEIARDIAIRFNNLYGETFRIPEPYIPEQGAKIYSLQEPTVKMSKSDENTNAYVSVIDTPEVIMAKFKRAVTDSEALVKYDPENKPGVSNLITVYSAMTGKASADIETEFAGKGYGDFKVRAAESVIEKFRPVREEYARLMKDKEHLTALAAKGAEKAERMSSRYMEKAERKVGLR